MEIIRSFGGKEKFLQALKELKKALYREVYNDKFGAY
jgi:hypothetical protein